MPPLYRMPIFYLTIALAGITGWLVQAQRGTTRSVIGSTPTAQTPLAPPAAPTPDEPTSKLVASSDSILRTANGLRRKVLVKELDLVPRSRPDGGQASGHALDYFSIPYLFGEIPPDAPQVFQVGPRNGPPQGWVPVDSVLEWDTRLMARPTPRVGRPALVIYRESSCLLDALAGRSCPKHNGHCPVEGEEAGVDGNAPSHSPAAGLPILQSLSIPQPDGTSRTVFEIASLVNDRAPIVPSSQPLPADLPDLRRVYVAFVIDTTASMQTSIDAARTMAETLVAEATRRYGDVTLRLALVEYRDESVIYGFRTRVVIPFTDPGGFRQALGQIAAAKQGDGSVDEQVLDGVASGLPRPTTEPLGAMRHLDWPTGRPGELATKLLVLLGDAPDHARDLERTKSLAAQAKDAGITIAAVRIDRSDHSRDEQARYRDQWRTLAEGSYRPLDRSKGFAGPIDPMLVALGEADTLAPRLQDLIDDRVAHARQLAALAAAEAENRLEEYVTSQGLTLQQVHPVLVDLHRGEAQPEARPDPRFHNYKAPSVRRGWIAEQIDGKPLVSIQMLMTRAELEALIGEFVSFQQATQGTARDLSELLRIGTAAASGETDFLAADRGGLTFAEHLQRRQGLPSAPENSLLRRTQADLLQADDLTRAAINERLGDCIRRLVQRHGEPDWSDPRQTIDGMALVPYEWIDF